MITEIAQIDVKPGMEAEFETGVKNAAPLFKRAKGCHGMELQRSIEKPEPLPAVRHLGDAREPHCRFSRLARLSGMAQARRPLLCLSAAGRARAAGSCADFDRRGGPRGRPPPRAATRGAPTRARAALLHIGDPVGHAEFAAADFGQRGDAGADRLVRRIGEAQPHAAFAVPCRSTIRRPD